MDLEKIVTAPRAVVALGLKFLWFTHPCFPATQKGPVPTSPPPGFPFFPESGSPGELCGAAEPSAEDRLSGTFCEGALLSSSTQEAGARVSLQVGDNLGYRAGLRSA